MNSNPVIEYRNAHPYAAIRMKVPIPFGKVLQPAWSKVHSWLAGKGLPHGPAIIRYLTTDMTKELDIDVGFVIDQSIPGDSTITSGILPAGNYATLLYTGSYKGKGVYLANVAIIEWAAKNGVVWDTYTKDGAEWWGSRVEWYLTDLDLKTAPKDHQTELTFLVAEVK
jgi:effector-binding domain-containing protein